MFPADVMELQKCNFSVTFLLGAPCINLLTYLLTEVMYSTVSSTVNLGQVVHAHAFDTKQYNLVPVTV